MAPAHRPVIANRSVAQAAGIGALVVGSLLLYDAYERRGRQRPWVMRLLPGS